MLGIFDLLGPGAKARRERVKAENAELLKTPTQWSAATKFEPALGLDGDSYLKWQERYLLFPDLEPGSPMDPDQPRVWSPSKRYYYSHNLLPQGARLRIMSGNRQGFVVFDRSVFFPTLVEQTDYSRRVWMSTTPMEVFTLRSGIRRAKGDVIVAGLGLGYQLSAICEKSSVKSVRVVEKDLELSQWLGKRIVSRCCAETKPRIIVGDAHTLLPVMTGDVAIVDIWDSYGGNHFGPICPDINHVWCWGSSSIADTERW